MPAQTSLPRIWHTPDDLWSRCVTSVSGLSRRECPRCPGWAPRLRPRGSVGGLA